MNTKWTLNLCKADALKYNFRTQWQLKSANSYQAALRNKWLDECCSHMQEGRKPNNYWTLELCKEDALKYENRKDWKQKSTAFRTAESKKWLKECTKHMKPFYTEWTLELCKTSALKCSSRNEWAINSAKAYQAARKNKWLDDCCSHMIFLKKPKTKCNLIP